MSSKFLLKKKINKKDKSYNIEFKKKIIIITTFPNSSIEKSYFISTEVHKLPMKYDRDLNMFQKTSLSKFNLFLST